MVFDRIAVYRRAGEAVPVRYVYEANIAAFLNSLHSLLDSFPYLLNLFTPPKRSLRDIRIGWCSDFIEEYRSMTFYDELKDFRMDPTFNKVKGYVNTIKHRHLIRTSNQWDHLEFEQYTYRKPYLNEQGEVRYQTAVAPREDVASFIGDCHNELIPKLFTICDSILKCKERELADEL